MQGKANRIMITKTTYKRDRKAKANKNIHENAAATMVM